VPDVALQEVGLEENEHTVERVFEIRSGDTLMELLLGSGIGRAEAHEAVDAMSELFSPRDLRPGHLISLSVSESDEGADAEPRIVELRLRPRADLDIKVSRGREGGFVAAAIDRPLISEVMYAASTIESSVFEAGQAQKVPLTAMAEVIRAFSYDVDFQRDIRSGDSFEILYEVYRDEQGTLAKTGNILYASLTLSGRTLEIYRFAPEGARPDYFKPNGESIRRALLRTPIDGARISSGFGMRKHPILGYSRMHKGIDFAAPTGTPIFAAGDGVITQIGRNGSYGNYIRIRHNSRYSTAYAHISRFAKGIRKGSRVRQGQVIAYVGSTGRSTGPHLHYEILAEGKQINPLGVKRPTGRNLEGEELKAFQAAKAEIDALHRALAQAGVLATLRPAL